MCLNALYLYSDQNPSGEASLVLKKHVRFIPQVPNLLKLISDLHYRTIISLR